MVRLRVHFVDSPSLMTSPRKRNCTSRGFRALKRQKHLGNELPVNVTECDGGQDFDPVPNDDGSQDVNASGNDGAGQDFDGNPEEDGRNSKRGSQDGGQNQDVWDGDNGECKNRSQNDIGGCNYDKAEHDNIWNGVDIWNYDDGQDDNDDQGYQGCIEEELDLGDGRGSEDKQLTRRKVPLRSANPYCRTPGNEELVDRPLAESTELEDISNTSSSGVSFVCGTSSSSEDEDLCSDIPTTNATNPNVTPPRDLGSHEDVDVTPPAASESDVPKSHAVIYWACPECAYKSTRADNLRRHMVQQHKWNKDHTFFRSLKHSNRKNVCPGCKNVRSNISRHKKMCPSMKALENVQQKKRKAPVMVAPPSKYVPSLHGIENSSVEECYVHFLGNRSASTKNNYKRHLRTFFKYIEDQCPGFNPKELFTSFTKPKDEAVVLRSAFIRGFGEKCTRTVLSNATKAISSFLNLYKDFVLCHESEADERIAHQANTNIDHGQLILKKLGRDASSEIRSALGRNRWKKRKNEDLSTQPQQVREYCKILLTSDLLKGFCQTLAKHYPKDPSSLMPCTVRDVGMMLLEMTSGGLRAVAIRSLSLGDFQERDIVSENPLEVVVRCHAHKTVKFYGAALFVIRNKMVYNYLCNYVKYARLRITGNEANLRQPNSPLFPSKRNRFLETTRSGIKWAQAALLKLGVKNESDPQLLTFTSAAIRKAFSDFATVTMPGEGDQEDIKIATARHMGHSAATADRHYHAYDEGSAKVSKRVHELLFGNCEDRSNVTNASEREPFGERKGSSDETLTIADPNLNHQRGTPGPHQFTESDREMLAKYFLRNQRVSTDSNAFALASKDERFVRLFETLLKEVNGSDTRAKHRIRSTLRKFERQYADCESDD